MLELRFIKENPKIVKENLSKRNQPEKGKWVDEIIKLHDEWLELKKETESLQHRRNIVSEGINKLQKQGKDFSKELAEIKGIPIKIKSNEERLSELNNKVEYYLYRIPNLLHKSVPIGKSAADNVEIRKWGKPKKFDFPLKSHVELAESLKIADFDAGRAVSGQGFNYLSNELAQLDFALLRYGIDFLLKHKFKLITPPLLLNRTSLSGAVDLTAFEDVIYKIENEDLYLVGTAEHSLVVMHQNKTIQKKDLPLKLCASTPCFRKEIGAHGVDTKGLFRMHQFNKVEQVCVTDEKSSYTMLGEMQKITEKFFQTLEIPYRVVEICSADLGGKFAKQYDIEAWFPRQNKYQEITSAGNCTDYQARRLGIRYIDGAEKKYSHILNNTMVATSRAMVAILENYQNKDGSVTIPKMLVKYTGFKKITMRN